MFYRVVSALFDPESAGLFAVEMSAQSLDERSSLDGSGSALHHFVAQQLRSAAESVYPEDHRTQLRRVRSVLEHVHDDPFLLLLEVSRYFVSERDGYPVFRFWESPEYQPSGRWLAGGAPHEKVQFWRDLSLRIDPTLVLAASFTDHRVPLNHPAILHEAELGMSDLEVDRALERGLADTHLHLSSAFSFRRMYTALVTNKDALCHRVTLNLLDDPGAPTRVGFTLLNALASALILREVLLGRPGDGLDAAAGQESCAVDPFVARARAFVGRMSNAGSAEEVFSAIREQDECSIDDYINRIETVRGRTPSSLSFGNETRYLTEQLHAVLGSSIEDLPGGPSAITRINGRGRDKWLLLYLQLKNLLYRAVVQEKGFPGFWDFRRRFESMSRLKATPISSLIDAALDPRVQVLEARINPGQSIMSLRDKVVPLLAAQRSLLLGLIPSDNTSAGCPAGSGICPAEHDCRLRRAESHHDTQAHIVSGPTPRLLPMGPACRVGVVAHFVKREPEINPGETFYDVYAREARHCLEAACGIRDLLVDVPELTSYLVAVDVANVETALPNVVFYPPITLLRDAWGLGARQALNTSGLLTSGRQTLGLTFHAGEDFYDLMSALRRMDDLIEMFQMRAGDRIGHGFAAGVDVEWWCHRHSPSAVTLEAEVLSRVWEWRLAREGVLDRSDFSKQEDDLHHLARHWFGTDVHDLGALAYLARIRHETFLAAILDDDDTRAVIGAEAVEVESRRQRKRVGLGPDLVSAAKRSGPPPSKPEWVRIMWAYLHDAKVFERGQRLRHIVHDHRSKDRMRRAQRYVCDKLAQRGLVVEANLSSNYVIEGLDRLSQHPLYRWCSPGSELCSTFRISINTDNPAVFSTRIANEFALVFYGALEAGLDRQDALKLIEDLRQNNLVTTFVRRRFPSRAAEMMHLCSTMERVRGAIGASC